MSYRDLLRQHANRVVLGDALDSLRSLPPDLFHCVVTSPPYYGLRDYGTRRWFGGDNPDCQHGEVKEHGPHHPGQVEQTKWRTAEAAGKGQTATTFSCVQCDAWYGQLGLEPTPELYVAHLVEVFREVRRVLRPDGVLWLNVGDSYVGGGGFSPDAPSNRRRADSGYKLDGVFWPSARNEHGKITGRKIPSGYKPKDLIGIPWMLAFALRSDGWFLRSETLWEKPNVMPESVRDRPTRAHEQIFLLTKSGHYFYDQEAEREPHSSEAHVIPWQDREYDQSFFPPETQQEHGKKGRPVGVAGFARGGRNLRTVWKINPQPYRGAHFAVFPPKLPERCIKLGTSERGACSMCGSPYRRIVERVVPEAPRFEENVVPNNTPHQRFSWEQQRIRDENPPVTKGWEPTCECNAELEPCVVLDPFSGSGTTLAVAVELGRNYAGIELNEAYGCLIEARLRGPVEEAGERDLYELSLQLTNEFDLLRELDEDFDDNA